MRCAVCIPIGPGDAHRLRSRVTSLFRCEPAVSLLVVADASGADATARLRELVPPHCQGVRLDCLAAAGGDCTPATLRLMALRYFADRQDYDLCVQLELTALVIAPFAERLGRLCTARPGVGQIGRVGDGLRTAVEGGQRAVQWRRKSRLRIGPKAWRDRGRDRKLDRLAQDRESGSFCVGGTCALTRPAIASLETAGLLAREWPAAADAARLTSALVLSTGWSVADHSAAGEVFGVSAAGLPGSPRQLAEEGYGLIGDVTTDRHHGEDEVIAYFDESDAQTSRRRAG